MSWRQEQGDMPNRTRRHLLGLAAAAGAKLTLISTAAWTAMQTSATSQVPGRGRSGAHGSNGANGAAGGAGAAGGNGGHGGHAVAGGPRCFLRGTSILTSTGEVRVEDLRIGDLVETAGGRSLPIRWIGRQSLGHVDSSGGGDLMPIRIARHAVDERTPHTDLYVSPWHALHIDGALIPAKDLVNGSSILPALPPHQDAIEYFHIVLDSHEVIFAEGMPAETLLIKGRNYLAFSNFSEFETLFPEPGAASNTSLAPTLGSGGREHLKSLLFLGLSRFADLTDPLNPIRRARERLAARAEQEID